MLNKVAEKFTGWTTKEADGRHYKELFVLSHEIEELIIDDPIEGVVIIGAVQELGNYAMLLLKMETNVYWDTGLLQLKILPLVLF